MTKGTIFDIQRFSVHDGQGIRTNVFLKGCPLLCRWCCNPESQKAAAEIGYSPLLCIGCGNCGVVCPNGAVSVMETGQRKFNYELCLQCEEKPCVPGCCAKAVSLFGREMTVEEVMVEVDKDRDFYLNSGGGVTASGGEPLTHADFVAELLEACQIRGYNTAVETCGHVSFDHFEKVIPYVDEFLCDIKHTDVEKFREWTGGNLELILENLRKLAARGCRITARIPVIPGFNDDEAAIESICRFAVSIGLREANLLPYHRLGKTKYEKLGRVYEMGDTETPEEATMKRLLEVANSTGIRASIGG